MLETVISCIAAFVGTNIDDMFINTFFFVEADTKAKTYSIVLGKYLGIGALVLLSVLGAFGLQVLPERYIGFLGLIPIGMGIREGVRFWRNKEETENEEEQRASGLVWNVMLVTMANGADNIGVYIPLFAGFEGGQLFVGLGIFAVMTALWCVLGKKMADLPVINQFLKKYKNVLVPMVYIALGVYIIFK